MSLSQRASAIVGSGNFLVHPGFAWIFIRYNYFDAYFYNDPKFSIYNVCIEKDIYL